MMRLLVKLVLLLCMAGGIQWTVGSGAGYEGWFLVRSGMLAVTQDPLMRETLVEEYFIRLQRHAGMPAVVRSAGRSNDEAADDDDAWAGFEVIPGPALSDAGERSPLGQESGGCIE